MVQLHARLGRAHESLPGQGVRPGRLVVESAIGVGEGDGGGTPIPLETVHIYGGVFGTMLSTPIINPPQSAILGVHATKDRAVVENDQIVIRPMMYLALSYDHRLVDGKDAVTFLVRVKECLEDPQRFVLEL